METQDDVIAEIQQLIQLLESLPPAGSQTENIERIQALEQAKRALAAAQAKETHALVQQRQAEEAAGRVPASLQLKGLDAEVGLARGESAFVGSALTHTATSLCTVLPKTLAALAAGRVSEYHARVIALDTLHLADVHRRKIDAALAHRLGRDSTAQLRKFIRGLAYRLDRKAAEHQAASNARRRRVCLDEGSNGQVYVTAELPAHQGLAVMDALHKATNKRLAAGVTDARGRPLGCEQVQADLFVELLTGQTTATGVTAEVVVIMHDTTLFGVDDLPAWVPGHGPLPPDMIKYWLADPAAKKYLRRMYTRPTDGQLVALESTRRRFPTGLAKMLRIRDDLCATPWCNNPIEDADHRTPWTAGGPTSWANATGLCKRCNQRKQNRGWTYTGTPDELTVTTPTGAKYTVSTLPPVTQIARSTSDPPLTGISIDIARPQYAIAVAWN